MSSRKVTINRAPVLTLWNLDRDFQPTNRLAEVVESDIGRSVMRAYRVSTALNNVRNDGPECVEAVA